MIHVKQLTPEDFPRWDAYVRAHQLASIYHLSEWISIFQTAYGKEHLYLFAERDGDICGIAPLIKIDSFISGKVLIGLPFVNYGGLICDDAQVAEKLLAAIEDQRRQLGFASVEVRAGGALNLDLPSKSNKVTFILDLPDDPEVLMQNFKAKLRSQIRRPLKEKMYARAGGTELLDDFYYVFCRNMRDLGTPVTAKKVFATILQELPQAASIVTVYSAEQQPAAAAFVLGFGDTMEIPWASSLRRFNRFSPNMLLYWEVLTLAMRQGYRKFDFGRGTKEGGTHRFKKQWGGTEKELFWYYLLPEGQQLPQVNKENPKFALAIRTWQKLPLPVANLIGPKLAVHLP